MTAEYRFKTEWRISNTDSVWYPMKATMTLREIDTENKKIGFKKYRRLVEKSK